ncbi:MAG: mechanosensitive ion channel, partial [Thermoanaerobaculia bacterium]|nr:mechanosensitive ion channel [Thermoanaerobaculia bacterium]
IESNDLRGVVRDIDLRQVHIRTPDGRDIFIPSAQIFKNPLVNFTRDHLRRAQFTIGIDYRDDPERARHILATAVAEHEAVLERPPATIEIEGFYSSTVDLGVYFWVRTDRSDLIETRSAVMAAARSALAEAGFTFASEVSTGVDVAPLTVKMHSDDEESES